MPSPSFKAKRGQDLLKKFLKFKIPKRLLFFLKNILTYEDDRFICHFLSLKVASVQTIVLFSINIVVDFLLVS
jgi:hypothetical protein